ncbi:biotin--[acetyl-CoA-carboxylase] ligase 3 [Tieghemostelium lacteum]|uniref:Biotin--[acetyl-CoA-carboxylase] ligase 3 n=1 Tax=Tieghemostelium lacteum TaxID=361077 RepID=A0A151ZC37_TIELA|nr:biotin--[acetyl-CoA-carboxylase] ligase 3 [Tieghemostelium lacteum]|eukprot:KYQ91517.1 biotin--[acetyl-CoA-carboxylase] ligase 3 [Tieghemostelium lacteum]
MKRYLSDYIDSNVVGLYNNSQLSKDINQYNNLKLKYTFKEYPTQLSPRIYTSFNELDQDSNNSLDEDILKIIISPEHLHRSIEESNDKNNNNNNNNNDTTTTTSFNIEKYFQSLKTQLFGRDLMYSVKLTSTQSLMMKYLEFTEQQGLVITCDQQSGGRGRGQNKWESPIGCLLFSYKCKLTQGTLLPFLQYIAGIAMIRALKDLPQTKQLPEGTIQLKWPNDIYTKDGIKIGGILCQSNYFNSTFDVVIGIGINVANDEPTLSLNQLLRKHNIQSYITRDDLLSNYFNHFEKIYIQFLQHGFKPFHSEYLSNWIHQNQVVLIKETNQYVKVVGLTDEGYLKAIECSSDGKVFDETKVHSLYPDGTSFDFKNSLILPKK